MARHYLGPVASQEFFFIKREAFKRSPLCFYKDFHRLYKAPHSPHILQTRLKLEFKGQLTEQCELQPEPEEETSLALRLTHRCHLSGPQGSRLEQGVSVQRLGILGQKAEPAARPFYTKPKRAARISQVNRGSPAPPLGGPAPSGPVVWVVITTGSRRCPLGHRGSCGIRRHGRFGPCLAAQPLSGNCVENGSPFLCHSLRKMSSSLGGKSEPAKQSLKKPKLPEGRFDVPEGSHLEKEPLEICVILEQRFCFRKVNSASVQVTLGPWEPENSLQCSGGVGRKNPRGCYEFPDDVNPVTKEKGGPRGPEPTRYGDWERKGRCIDF
ncbi:succinate dehydrogenase assembly factor 4, mitochondrial [Tamandua tetradactyla]|uniref:succinate dehydrogenase assembly factor 4, mitochondrial n=1 Tax=Tamandua tetradactyla TaxID=48850 RepID=UPI0040538437